MDERGALRIAAGMEVYDRDNHKLGTVTHVHELDAPPAGAGAAGDRGYLEVATGLLSRLGLAKPLFVPLEAVRDVTEGGVFLAAARAEADRADWHTRPAALDRRESPPAAPPPGSAPPAAPVAVAALEDWAAAAPHYRRRWEAQHGAGGPPAKTASRSKSCRLLGNVLASGPLGRPQRRALLIGTRS